MIYGLAFRALGAIAIAGGIWYGIDSVASALRERKQLRYDLDAVTRARDEAAANAEAIRAASVAELAARDEAARRAQVANRKIEKELRDAKTRLAEWAAGADADLARCLAQPVPGWLLDGSGAPIVTSGATARPATR